MMGAGFMQAPELQLSKEEADAMSTAIAEVTKHYPVVVEPKYAAITNLAIVACAVYFPRVRAMRARKQMERQHERAQAQAAQEAEGMQGLDPAAFGFPAGVGGVVQ